MTIKTHTQGGISLPNDIRVEFGGPTSNVSLYSYRAGGPHVPAGTNGYPKPSGVATAISSGSNVSMNTFYGASATLPATYSLVANAGTVNEGSPVVFTINTTNVPNGTVLDWGISTGGQPIDYATIPNDFTAPMAGSVAIYGNTAAFSVTPAADQLTESGAQNFWAYITPSGGGVQSLLAYSSPVSIADTSKTPAVYTVTADQTTVGEGGADDFITFNITATGDHPSYVNWAVEVGSSGDPADWANIPADFFIGEYEPHEVEDPGHGYHLPWHMDVSGFAVLSNGSGTFYVRPIADGLTERSPQKFFVRVWDPNVPSNSATSQIISIIDTSQGGTPPPPPPTPFIFNDTVAADTSDYNIYYRAQGAGWSTSAPLTATITINAGVRVTSNSVFGAALSTGAGFPAGTTLRLNNNGFILGRGGAGGAGGNAIGPSLTNGSPGQAGGPALEAQYALSVYNNGTIGGGGGGGGGGGSALLDASYDDAPGGGGDGGGGD